MTRKECLEHAMGCVLRDRQKQYGEPEDCFETIAMMWSAYLGKIIQGWDVAAMMALLKIARIKANPAHADNWCDLAGYAACGAECRQKFEAEMKKTVEDAFETFPHLKPKAEDEPKFEPGDHLILTYPNGEGRPCVYVGESIRETAFCLVRYDDDGTTDDVPVDDLRRVPKRAEGCEALVFDEARMRESMPGIVPQDGPSDMDKPWHPHKPTGEELAEMAEEDGNA